MKADSLFCLEANSNVPGQSPASRKRKAFPMTRRLLRRLGTIEPYYQQRFVASISNIYDAKVCSK